MDSFKKLMKINLPIIIVITKKYGNLKWEGNMLHEEYINL
jgi:hypothetical protein